MNCSAVSVEAVDAVDGTLHFVELRSAEGAQLSAVQRSRLKARVGELQFKVHDVGRPAGAGGAGPHPLLLREENIVAVSRKLTSAEQKVARRRSDIVKADELRFTTAGKIGEPSAGLAASISG